ncbi:hypothetical protein [Microbacterium sp.]|uniref:hypothetical protein n=1 Tax=Microbacterium sp. TaxID=51671 RepID=UPI0035648064
MTESTMLRVIRISALYDLVVTAGFALPWSAVLIFGGLDQAHEALGLTGTTPSPDDVFTVMFANLMGSIVVVWAAFRIVRPSTAAGIADTAARMLFSLGMATALLYGASPLTGIMLALELVWALVQGAAIIAQSRRAARSL